MRSLILSLLLVLFLVDVGISLKQRDCKCRIQPRRKRIIGGRKAGPISFPWMVSLQNKESNYLDDWDDDSEDPDSENKVSEETKIKDHFCGGVIIHERWVLTAAHCINGESVNSFHVGYGESDLVAVYDRKQYADVQAVYKHPDYKRYSSFQPNDIGLIKLVRPLNFTEAVQPACLPTRSEKHYTGDLKITGFGRVDQWVSGDHDHASRYLKEAITHDVSDDPDVKCQKEYNICVENRKDSRYQITCNGDSGGPMHQTKWGRTTVIGLTSYGDSEWDGEEKVYCVGFDYLTRVSSYMDWVKDTVGDDICL